jgi:hypothetical protein
MFLDCDNPLTFLVFDRMIGVYEQSTHRLLKLLSFSQVLLDVDIEPKKALLAVCMVNKVSIFTVGGEI